MVEQQPSKLNTRVRFPSPAPVGSGIFAFNSCLARFGARRCLGVQYWFVKGFWEIGRMRNLVILLALALAWPLAGCSVGALNLGTTNEKGQPLSAVVTKLGSPEEQGTIEGQKTYTWIRDTSLYQCRNHVRDGRRRHRHLRGIGRRWYLLPVRCPVRRPKGLRGLGKPQISHLPIEYSARRRLKRLARPAMIADRARADSTAPA